VAAHTASPAGDSVNANPVLVALGVWRDEAITSPVRPDFSDLDIRGPPAL